MIQGKTYSQSLKLWLLIGVIMVFVQIILGGITRLTGSGLSITKWEIATGTIPPMNQEAWKVEFDLYKETPQYEKINSGMTMSEFKFIYFWEYIHRLWARTMGFVFLFPFLFFIYKKWIDKILLRKLLLVVALAAIAASFGWIMVASGMVNRPWVNAYKLTIHLNLGFMLFGFLFLTYLYAKEPEARSYKSTRFSKLVKVIFWVVVVQLLLGGVMSGMKAGLFYPTWPDMNGEMLPAILLDYNNWNTLGFIDYDKYALAPALFQFCHRLVAYVLFVLVLVFAWKMYKYHVPGWYKERGGLLVITLLVQLVLGIYTVLNCVGKIPLVLGVLHQAGAVFLIMALLYLMRGTKEE